MLESWPCVESLLIHTRFYDVTRLRGWSKFRGLRVDCMTCIDVYGIVTTLKFTTCVDVYGI